MGCETGPLLQKQNTQLNTQKFNPVKVDCVNCSNGTHTKTFKKFIKSITNQRDLKIPMRVREVKQLRHN